MSRLRRILTYRLNSVSAVALLTTLGALTVAGFIAAAVAPPLIMRMDRWSVSEGEQVIDERGQPIGTVEKIEGDTALVKYGGEVIRKPVRSLRQF